MKKGISISKATLPKKNRAMSIKPTRVASNTLVFLAFQDVDSE